LDAGSAWNSALMHILAVTHTSKMVALALLALGATRSSMQS